MTIMMFYMLMIYFSMACAADVDLLIKRMDRMESEFRQEKISFKQQVAALQMKLDSYREFCKTLPDNVCGQCMCKDDDRLPKKYYCDCQNLDPKRDCLEFKQFGNTVSGIYKVHFNNMKVTQVYCDQESDGGGWTVIQRRLDGSVNFQRDWNNYKDGFGQLQNEFWLGNDNIFLLSLQGLYPRGNELRVDLVNAKGIKKHAKYKQFEIGSSLTSFKLHIKGHSGTAMDGLSRHNGMKFSTYNNDNDIEPSQNCAQYYSMGGWWYDKCFLTNLNGIYYHGGVMLTVIPLGATGIHWGEDSFSRHKGPSLIFSEMKVRRNV